MIPPRGDKMLLLIDLLVMIYYGNRDLIKKARELRGNLTRAEILLWSRLRSKQLDGYKFRRQQPIFDYIVDFYCYELKLIIEIDGEIHSSKETHKYDKKRDMLFKINGYKILRLSNFEIEADLNSAIHKIRSFINKEFVPLPGGPQGVILPIYPRLYRLHPPRRFLPHKDPVDDQHRHSRYTGLCETMYQNY